MQGLRRNSDTRRASDSLAQLTLNKRSVQLVGSEPTTRPSRPGGPAAPLPPGRRPARGAATEAKTGAKTPLSAVAATKTAATATAATTTAAAKTAANAARGTTTATAALSGEEDSNEQAAAAARDAFARASQHAGGRAARGTATLVRGGAKASTSAVRGGIVAAQRRVAAAKAAQAAQGAKSAKTAADTVVTIGRGAAALTRAATASAAAVKSIAMAIAAAVSSTPVIAIVSGVLVAVVAVLSIISWLPGITTAEREYGNGGKYGTYPVGVPPGAWGGWENGRIPSSALSTIPWATHHVLRGDATAALAALNEAYRAEFGTDMAITDAYRDYAGQVAARARWCGQGACRFAAVPGTSNHGWALAVDLGGGINRFGTTQYQWMKNHAPEYGWQHPSWAEPNGSTPEPWHWEFWGWEGSGGGGAAVVEGDAQEYARQRLPAVFGSMPDMDAQFTCLQTLWTNESGWNHTAKNPSSGAYGIPQSLPADKMASHGADWRTNPATQIDWGLDYIRDRYKTPCQAWDFWQSKKPHWY